MCLRYSSAEKSSLINPLGYVYDTESGLYYLQSRYYDPKIGRFINADAFASTGQGILGNNMFAYCGNNPVANVDSSGFAYMHTRERMIDGGSGGASVAGGGLGLLIPFVWMIDTVGNVVDTFDDWIDEQKNALSEAQAYAKVISGPDEKYHAHHIVAKKDLRAEPARIILESVDIDPLTYGLNFAIIPQSKHSSLHTTKYYTYINSRFEGLEGNRNAIVWTLAELQVEIQLYCHTGLKAW